MAKFKIGDRVRVTEVQEWMSVQGVAVGMTGVVMEYSDVPFVRLDHYRPRGDLGHDRNVAFVESRLELITDGDSARKDTAERDELAKQVFLRLVDHAGTYSKFIDSNAGAWANTAFGFADAFMAEKERRRAN